MFSRSHAPLTVVQLSDLHLFARPNDTLLDWSTHASLKAVLEDVVSVGPDLVVITGDLSQDGSMVSYRHLRAMLSVIDCPCYCIPGNHDNPAMMAAVLQGPPVSLERSFEAGGWRFLLLDSSVLGQEFGALGREKISWLHAELGRTELPTAIVLHHPPVTVGASWLDVIALREPLAVLELTSAFPQVQLILCGHVHQATAARAGRARVFTCPSTCFQFKPNSEAFSLDDAEPGYRLLRLFADGTSQTVVRRVAFQQEANLEATGY